MDSTRYDTTYIEYNTDSTVHQITGSGTYEVVTFYYSPGLIKRVAGPIGFSPIEVDSIVLNSNGLPAADYHITIDYPYGYVYRLYTYNAAGELARTIVVHPNHLGYPPDTITHIWQVGDMVNQSSENGEYISYNYNNNEACVPAMPYTCCAL